MIRTFQFDGTQKNVGPKAIAPIYAAQMNLVGVNGGRREDLASGQGTITYRANGPLTAEGQAPSTIHGTNTTESSNITYAQLPSGPQSQFVQTFGVGTRAFNGTANPVTAPRRFPLP